jgi:hypothetical protein
MPYNNTDAGDPFLVVIAIVALILFLLMLLATFVVVRLEGRTKTAAGEEQEPTPLRAGGEYAGPLARARSRVQENARVLAFSEWFTARQPAIVRSFRTLSWRACCIVAPVVAFFGYGHVERTLPSVFQIPGYYYWTAAILAIFSPACLAVAWLRLVGFPWRQALKLFLLVPVGALIIWYTMYIIGEFLYRYFY